MNVQLELGCVNKKYRNTKNRIRVLTPSQHSDLGNSYLLEEKQVRIGGYL